VLPTPGEILPGVIDDVICAVICDDRLDQVHVPGTAYGGDFRAERFCDLYSERTHASGRAVDQDLQSRLDLPLATQAA
jgi:hypothetical protein